MPDSPRVRRCKSIRDRIYDRKQFGWAIFEKEVQQLLSTELDMIDIGCGRDAKFLRSLSSQVKKCYGVDLDVSETIVDGNLQIMYGDAESIPLPNGSVDVITMINVTEHLRDPKKVLKECKRILNPGGSIVLLAPCKFYPPILLGRALPHCLRRRLNRHITSTDRIDTFPAYYRANSHRTLHRLASLAGLDVVSVRYLINHPEYFMFSTLIYRLAVEVERFLLEKNLFHCFRHQVFCHLKRPCE